MLRTALRPRWLALLAVVLILASGMAWLGQWQLDRARERGSSDQEAVRTPVPVQTVLRPRQRFTAEALDRPVTARGRWDGARTLLVPGREQKPGGPHGFWVLLPLVLDDGSAVPVVRGWVRAATDPGASPDAVDGSPGESVQVTGVLQPSEAPAARRPGEAGSRPEGQLERIAVAELVSLWPYPMITGYLVRTGEVPAPTGPAPDQVTVAEAGGGGLRLRNLSYALQWWVFAGFGLFFWFRLVRDAAGDPAQPGAAEVGEHGADRATSQPRTGDRS